MHLQLGLQTSQTGELTVLPQTPNWI